MKKQNRRAFWFSIACTAVLFALLIGFCFFVGSSLSARATPAPATTGPADTATLRIIDVPYHDQSGEYPTGCEIVSAAMILHYYGYSTTIDTLIDDYLDTCEIRTAYPAYSAASPDEAFLGDPRSPDSYGCYAPVIVNMLNRVMTGHTTKELSGESLSSLCHRFLDRDIPVLVWATIDMQPSSTGTQFQLPDGSTFQWISPEHCLVLVGYDDQFFYLNDPYQHRGVVAYPRETVSARYEELGQQAVVIVPTV